MKRKNSKLAWFVLVPAMTVFFLFHTLPLLQGVFYSFTDFKGYGNWEFVGFRNYLNIFSDMRVRGAYVFTLSFSILSTILVNIISILIALGLNSKIKYHKTLRAIYFVPYMLGTLIIGYVFSFIFSRLLPQIGTSLDISWLQFNMLGNPNLAWIGIVVVAVWQSAAFNTILYLSGLVTIDPDLYEAADIDGAKPTTKFFNITLPLIMPFFTINMVVAMKNFLMVFDQIIALTGGGPGTSTESVSLLIYRGGFQGGEFAYQSANAVLFFIIIAVISLFQIRVLERREN
ncbi:carbohydrate ABC transporter permease [Alkalibacterium sp. f15]|uniref:carbohydrate ABC transporter permease n=1 Tax=Alkalibacterium sp. f15 TaxID=3414029 RepID=UPI003BF8B93A